MFANSPRVLLFALTSALVANAAIYVTAPTTGATCHGGQACTVTWVDDGQAPLLSAIGETRVGLYTSNLKLVQTIQPVNVNDARSLTFTPNPKAGPNSDSYYIAFIPTSDSTYRGYTPWFALDDMTGSFATPDPSATSSLPLPSGSASPSGNQTTIPISGSTPKTVPTTETATVSNTTPGATTAATATSSGISSGASGASSGASSAASSTGSSSSATSARSSAASSTATPLNGAVSNGVPATGFVWILLAFLGTTLF